MFLLELVFDVIASAFSFGRKRRGRPPREPWSVRRSRRRMEKWREETGRIE